MLSDDIIYYGVVLFPMLFYHVWVSRHPVENIRYPYALGIYGGLSTALTEQFPAHVFQASMHMSTVPIVIATLYGGRKASIVSLCIALFYLVVADPSHGWWAFALLVLFALASLPFSSKIYMVSIRRRITMVVSLSVLSTVVHIVVRATISDVPIASVIQIHSDFGLRSALTYVCTVAINAILVAYVLEGLRHTYVTQNRLLESTYAVKLSEERYHSLVRYNPAGICSFDLAGRLLSANLAYQLMVGYAEDELFDFHADQAWFSSGERTLQSILESVQSGVVIEDAEGVVRAKDGHFIEIRYTVIPTIVEGQIVGFFNVIRDVSKTKLAEDLLRKAEKLSAVGELAASVAHEIRNPLTTVQGFLQLIERETPQYGLYYRILHEELQRIDQISSELLALAKPQADQMKDISVTEWITQVGLLLLPYANLNNVHLHIAAPIADVYVRGTLVSLKQALINVVRNAIEATPAQGRVDVRVDVDSDSVTILVEDNGVGMTGETVARLGEPFFTNKGLGTGLGLTVTHRIVDRYEGNITYTSRINEGTTVRITFPTIQKEVAVSVK